MSDTLTCVVTGGNAGIGEATVTGLLARRDVAAVHMICRDAHRAEEAAQRIAKRTGRRPEIALADLSRPREVLRISRELAARLPRIDRLILNAAVVTRQREATEDGIERQLAVNHLAYFVMARELLLKLAASQPARIVVVASNAHFRGQLNLEDFNAEHGFASRARYAETKLMNVLFTAELARRIERDGPAGVTVNCLHPGVIATNLLLSYSPFRTLLTPLILLLAGRPSRGAETSLYLATADDLGSVNGRFFRDRKEVTPSNDARDKHLAHALWEKTEALVDKVLAS